MKINWGRFTLPICIVVLLLLEISNVFAAQSFIDPSLQDWSAQPTVNHFAGVEKREVIVFLKSPRYQNRSGLSQQMALFQEKNYSTNFLKDKTTEFSAIIGQQKAKFLWSSNAIVISIDKNSLKQLSKNSDVDGIVENKTVTLDQPIFVNNNLKTDESSMTYGLQVIHAKSAWEKGIDGTGVVVGVIDTGVDETHPDLVGKILLKKDFTRDNDNKDCNGHGTHVSGTIVGGNASGTTIGVAPGAKIIMAKVLDCNGSASLATLLSAMEWMLNPSGDANKNDAPKIISNSWGGSTQFMYGFRNIVKTWRRFGILPAFAAGNSGSSYFSVNAPGSYPFSFTIGAVDENLELTSFSSRGPTIWWNKFYPVFYTKPNISAPGLDVLSALPENSTIVEALKRMGKEVIEHTPEKNGGHWARISGTSMATPHVSAVAALALQANPKLSVEDLATILNSTALDQRGKGMNNKFGNGIVQVDQVIEKAKTWQLTNQSSSRSFFQDKDPSLWVWDTP
ncbi:MAG: S8 family serine peptidase [Deltaproteobacteria bacterium]|nr:S8 family serine peptidase [Deltaproteobacteria bacterium]